MTMCALKVNIFLLVWYAQSYLIKNLQRLTWKNADSISRVKNAGVVTGFSPYRVPLVVDILANQICSLV